MNDDDILAMIRSDEWMMEVLRAARTLDLPDWMIGAGFIRNKVWDRLHGYAKKEADTSDIDLIYFDPSDLSEASEEAYNEQLRALCPVNWETVNQARMHVFHGRELPYKNSEDALSEWVETPTCVAVRLEKDDTITLFAPHGTSDLLSLTVRPTPAFLHDLEKYWGRVNSKHWKEKWPKLTILER
jgi:hypothetical protein